MPRLEFLVGDKLFLRFTLGDKPVNIGRHKWCEVQLPDTTVSRFHAKITCDEEGGYWVENCSTFGTRLNASSLEDRTQLRSGDVLYIGEYVIVYYPEDAPDLDEEFQPTLVPE